MRVSRRGLPPGPFFSKFLLQMARKEEWTGGAFDNATSVDVEIDPHRRRLGLQKKCTFVVVYYCRTYARERV